MSSEKEKQILGFIDKGAVIILLVCAVALVMVMGVCVCRKQQIPAEHHIVLTISTDSISSSMIDVGVVDSINNIITQHEILLKEHYRYLLEKRDWDDSIITIGSLLVGIIISILGFFGFRSFKSIEEKSSEVAKEESQFIAKQQTNKYLDLHLEDILFEKYIIKISDNVSSTMRDSIVAELSSNIETIKGVVECVEDNREKIEKIESKMNVAFAEIENLSNKRIEIKSIESSEGSNTTENSPTNPFIEVQHL